MVDDNPWVFLTLAVVLENDAHRVATTANSDLAWKLPVTTDVDVVVTDIGMPRVSGIDLIWSQYPQNEKSR